MLPSTTPEDSLTKQSVVAYKKNLKFRKALAYLYQEGSCTLAELASELHTSIPSVTNLVDQLIDDGWVIAIGTAAGNNGRRPAVFRFNPTGHYSVILDSGTHGTRLLIVNLLRQILFEKSVDYPLEDRPEFSAFLVDFVNDCLLASGLARQDMLGVGLSLPGLIDSRQSLNLSYPRLGMPGQSLTSWLELQWQLPVFLLNDTKATALGEHRFGRAKGKQHALAINIDWGVGLGIIINGDVFQGASGFAGELGHIQADPKGSLCYCGKIGCVDTLASASALVRRVQQAVVAGQATQLAALRHVPEQITVSQIVQAAYQGDAFAIEQLYETGSHLGKALAIAVTLFNPEVIIVDGVLAEASLFVTNALQQAINRYCLSGFRDTLTVEITQLNGDAKWLGTHAHLIENLFAAA